MFFFQLDEFGGRGFQISGELVDRGLFLGVITGNDQRLGDQVAGPAFVLFLAFLVRFDDRLVSAFQPSATIR